MRQVLSILALSVSLFGCSFFPPEYKVPLSFSVHVSNDHGAVVGLKLRVTHFKSAEFSKLTSEEQKAVSPTQFIEVIAESVTDSNGDAHFNLSAPGHFDVQPDHPANSLDWFYIDGQPDAAPQIIKLVWPGSRVLQAKHLRGRITDGLMSSHSTPVGEGSLTLHSLVSFNQIDTTNTLKDGSFRFADVPTGPYFVRIEPRSGRAKSDASHAPEEGDDIPIYVDQGVTRDLLSIAVSNTRCALFYDLEENKAAYKPEACFKGRKSVPSEQ